MLKLFNLTKRQQNHVLHERYNCKRLTPKKATKDKKQKKFCFNSFINDINRDFDLEYAEQEGFLYDTDTETIKSDGPHNEIKGNHYEQDVITPTNYIKTQFNTQRFNKVITPKDNTKRVEFYNFVIISQNVRGLKDDLKIKNIINNMVHNNINAFMIQETWKTGNSVETIRNHTIFYHSINKHKSRRGERGIAIVLSPKFYQFYEEARGVPPRCTTTDPGNELGGRYMELTLKIKGLFKAKKEAFQKKKTKYKEVTLRLASCYTSRDINEQLKLQEFLTKEFKNSNPNYSLIIVQDSNVQVGIAEMGDEGEIMDKNVGKWGLERRDEKGNQLLDFVR